jgi:hypothetical protein
MEMIYSTKRSISSICNDRSGQLHYPSDAETSFLKGYSSFYAYISLRCTPTHVTHIKELEKVYITPHLS